MIRQNLVREQFEELGYTIIAFETSFYWTEWDNADIYVARSQGNSLITSSPGTSGGRLSTFETLFINTTLLRAVIDLTIEIVNEYTPEDDAAFNFRALDESGR